MLAADANLATRDSAKIATGPGEQERADRAAVEAARTAIAMAGTRLAERGQAAAGQQGDAERTEVQARRAAAANPATRASATTKAGEYIKDLAVRDAGKAGGDKAAAAASSGKVAKTMAAAGQEVDAERAEFQSMKAAGANPSTRGGAKTDPGKSVKDLSVRDAEKATANKATAEAPADKATADKATGDKATGDKATGDKSASAANSDKDAGTTAAAASSIDPRFAITTYKGKDGQEYIQLPDIRTPGKPGERMQNAETERHSIRPLNQTPDDQKENWYESVTGYFDRVGKEIMYDVKRGYQTAQEGLAQLESVVKNTYLTFTHGSEVQEQVNSAVAQAKQTVMNNAGTVSGTVRAPSIDMEKIDALGRRALQQIPAQQGAAPSGHAAYVEGTSVLAVAQVNGEFMLSGVPIKGGARVSVELASATIGQSGSWVGKNGEIKLGVVGAAGVVGLPVALEVGVGLTVKPGTGTRVDSVSVEPVYDFGKDKFVTAFKGAYDMVAGFTTPGPMAVAAPGMEMQLLGRDVSQEFGLLEVGGINIFDTPPSDTPASARLPALQPVDTFETSVKATVMNTDAATKTFRPGWQGGVTGGVELQGKHIGGGTLQYGTSQLNGQVKLLNIARAGFAVGDTAFVASAGLLISD
jgi:hypothetical protein